MMKWMQEIYMLYNFRRIIRQIDGKSFEIHVLLLKKCGFIAPIPP